MIGPRVAQALRQRGMDVGSVAEDPALRGLADEALLQYAQAERRILVTRNVVDFARLDQLWRANGREHPGLVMLSEQTFPQNRNLIGSVVTALGAAADHGHLPAPGGVLFLRSSDQD